MQLLQIPQLILMLVLVRTRPLRTSSTHTHTSTTATTTTSRIEYSDGAITTSKIKSRLALGGGNKVKLSKKILDLLFNLAGVN